MIVNKIKPDTIPTWKAEFLRKEHTNVVLEKIRTEIENDWQLKKYPSSPFACGLRRAMEIIDKYIEGSDSECHIV